MEKLTFRDFPKWSLQKIKSAFIHSCCKKCVIIYFE